VAELKILAEPFDHVVCALGSGGTCAGLEIGRALEDLDFEVIAINVCDDEASFRRRLTAIFDEFDRRFGLPEGADPGRIRIIDGFVGPGYAKTWPEELRLIRDVALHTGVFLDPVYTGKAFFGLVDRIRMKGFSRGDRVLFIHTGGIFGLLARCSEFADLLDPS
jgi:D-cysteine desulfhydrase